MTDKQTVDPNPENQVEPANVHALTVLVCQDCIDLKGEMCNNPQCVFCRRTMVEVQRYLDVILLCPIVDGKRLILVGDAVTDEDTRRAAVAGPRGYELPICPKCQQGYICEHCGEPIGDYYAATSSPAPARGPNWNAVLAELADTAIKCHIGFKHEGPWEDCEWIECEDRRKMIESASAMEHTTQEPVVIDLCNMPIKEEEYYTRAELKRRFEVSERLRAAPTERTRVEGEPPDEGLITLLMEWRKWYSEDLFSPWTTEEAQAIHAEFPGAVDRVSADSARGTIDNVIADIRAGKHLPKEDCSQCGGSGFEGEAQSPCSFCGGDGWLFATPADNDALEVCRLLSTLDWIVGYELAGENQTILDRAQELALKVMGMTDPAHDDKGGR